MSQANWIDDLFVEKNLWQASIEARDFPSQPFNRKFRRFMYALAAPCGAFIAFGLLDENTSLRGVDSASALVSSISATILGFLVAGLAIFTTLSDKKILVVMAQTPQINTAVSVFKYLYYNLLNVFLVYISSLSISSVIQVFSKIAMPLNSIEFAGIIFRTATIINSISLIILGLIFAEICIVLKSFIWNIYATFISVLTVSSVVSENEPERA